ncbi:hypothetical protein SODALDRAFT_333970, partial [Sodiomyces alkalinus F11]
MSDNPGPGLTDEIVEEAYDLIHEAEEEAHMDENQQVRSAPDVALVINDYVAL